MQSGQVPNDSLIVELWLAGAEGLTGLTSPATFGSSIVQVTQLTQLMNFHLLSFRPGSTMTATYAALGRLAFQAMAHGRCDD